MKSLSWIMKRAWQIRRDTAKKHKVKQSQVHMHACMKLAWKQARQSIKRIRPDRFIPLPYHELKLFGRLPTFKYRKVIASKQHRPLYYGSSP